MIEWIYTSFREYIWTKINIWMIKMIMIFDWNSLLHSGSSDTFIILYLNPFVSDGWRLTIHMYISSICIWLFVMQIHYAVWVILMVSTRTWLCELRLVVDGSFFIMLVHPRPIMQREKSQRVYTITFPMTKIKQELFLLRKNTELFVKFAAAFPDDQVRNESSEDTRRQNHYSENKILFFY